MKKKTQSLLTKLKTHSLTALLLVLFIFNSKKAISQGGNGCCPDFFSIASAWVYIHSDDSVPCPDPNIIVINPNNVPPFNGFYKFQICFGGGNSQCFKNMYPIKIVLRRSPEPTSVYEDWTQGNDEVPYVLYIDSNYDAYNARVVGQGEGKTYHTNINYDGRTECFEICLPLTCEAYYTASTFFSFGSTPCNKFDFVHTRPQCSFHVVCASGLQNEVENWNNSSMPAPCN